MNESNHSNPTESSAAGKESSPTQNAEGKFARINNYIVTGNAAGQPHLNSRIIAEIEEGGHALAERLIRRANSHDALLAACRAACEFVASEYAADNDQGVFIPDYKARILHDSLCDAIATAEAVQL